ncbi:unnamed protein product [Calypogeia fissa]
MHSSTFRAGRGPRTNRTGVAGPSTQTVLFRSRSSNKRALYVLLAWTKSGAADNQLRGSSSVFSNACPDDSTTRRTEGPVLGFRFKACGRGGDWEKVWGKALCLDGDGGAETEELMVVAGKETFQFEF